MENPERRISQDRHHHTQEKKGRKSGQNVSKKDVADTKCQISEISSTLTEMKTYIAAFSAMPQGTNSKDSNNGQEAPVSGYAGNYFGGRTSKRTKTRFTRPLYLVLFGLMKFVKFYLLTRLRGINLHG